MDNDNKTVLDDFGKCVIEEVYDRSLYGAKRILELTTKNPIDLERYSILSQLTEEQQEKIYELMTKTTVDVIYRFLEMIEEHDDEYKIIVEKDNKKYSLTDISEKMGSEIADIDYEDGWIRRFSRIDETRQEMEME